MKEYDVIIVGAGPAGLGAAYVMKNKGVSCAMIDENKKAGGQLFKQIHKFFGSSEHYAGMRGTEIGEKLITEIEESDNVDIYLGAKVFGIWDKEMITAIDSNGNTMTFKAKYIVLATGAIENSLTFAGNTLPGVMSAGAVQTMMNEYRVRPGKKAVVIGSGNVGLIVAYQMLLAGMEVQALVEIGSKINGYTVHARKIKRAGVKVYTGYSIKAALGEEQVEKVIIGKVNHAYEFIENEEIELDVDTVCVAAGMTPEIELAKISGCEEIYQQKLGGILPIHNSYMRTSVSNVLIAGDLSGIEEASTALDEGKMAGTTALYQLGYLTEKEYVEETVKIQKRLDGLRNGDFGVARRESKLNIWSQYKMNEEGMFDENI